MKETSDDSAGVDELRERLRATRKELRDTQRVLLVTYLIGAKATEVARSAGLNCEVSEDVLGDALAKFDAGDIGLVYQERNQQR